MMLGAMLKDVGNAGQTNNVTELNQMLAGQREKVKQQALMGNILKSLGGGFQESAGPQLSGPAGVRQEAPIDQVQLAPPPQPVGGLPRMNERAPSQLGYSLPQKLPQRQLGSPEVQNALLAGWAGKLPNMDGLVSILDKSRPEYSVDTASGETYNKYDPSNAGKRFQRREVVNDKIVDPFAPGMIGKRIPKIGEGMIEDEDGRIGVGQGYLESLARIEGARAGAVASVEAPYKFEDYTDDQGRPVRAAQSTMAGRSFAGQTPAEREYSTAAGKDAAEREKGLREAVAADDKIMPLIADMKALLDSGNVVTGFGANEKLLALRAAAAIGDKRAQESVAATETYQNLTKRQVLPIVKQLGSGNGITDADRKFTSEVVAGNIELNEKTMRRVIEIAERQAKFNKSQLEGFRPPARSTSGGQGGAGYTVKAVRRAQ